MKMVEYASLIIMKMVEYAWGEYRGDSPMKMIRALQRTSSAQDHDQNYFLTTEGYVNESSHGIRQRIPLLLRANSC